MSNSIEELKQGTEALDQGRMSLDPIRGSRSDEGLTETQRRGDYPNTQGPISSEQRTGFDPYPVDPAAGVATFDSMQDGADTAKGGLGPLSGDQFYDELARHQSERRAETTSWKDTKDDLLPASRSKEFPFGRDVPKFGAKVPTAPAILENPDEG